MFRSLGLHERRIESGRTPERRRVEDFCAGLWKTSCSGGDDSHEPAPIFDADERFGAWASTIDLLAVTL